MTEDEAMRWKTLIDHINGDIADYEMREQLADNSHDARDYGSAAWHLKHILGDIHEILHGVIADEYQKRMEQDIASMEQGIGGE
jgi:hypothetical protein